MANYSKILNDEVTEINIIAVDNFGAESFIGAGSSAITQTIFTDVIQNQTLLITHAEDVAGVRLVQISELVVPDNVYEVKYTSSYLIENYSSTQTRITKLSVGTNSIKVNILI